MSEDVDRRQCDRRLKYDEAVRRSAARLFSEGKGYTAVASLLGISVKAARKWQMTFKVAGAEGLLHMGGRTTAYTYETKLAAARAVVEQGMTKAEAMRRYGIMSVSSLDVWCRRYRMGGADALLPRSRGRAGKSKGSNRTAPADDC